MNRAALEFDAAIENPSQLEYLRLVIDHHFNAAIDAKRPGGCDDAGRLADGGDFG